MWYSKLFDRSIYARSGDGVPGFDDRLREQTLKAMEHEPAPLPPEVAREIEEMAGHWT